MLIVNYHNVLAHRPSAFNMLVRQEWTLQKDFERQMADIAERYRVVALSELGGLTNPLIINYLNRLGDLLFVLARYHDRELPIERATGDRS